MDFWWLEAPYAGRLTSIWATAPSQASHDPPNTSRVNLYPWIPRFSSCIDQKGEHTDLWAHNEASSVTKVPNLHYDTWGHLLEGGDMAHLS
jgi:hypothetical protein